MSKPTILVSEVGLRDGLQSVPSTVPTAVKMAWIQAEVVAGVREIEVGSFVPAKLLPQLADTPELVRTARKISGLTVAALVPNLQGACAAVDAGAHKITLPFSVSETHNMRNLRRNHAQMIAEVTAISELLASLPADKRPHFEVSLSTAFGCTIEGAMPQDRVARFSEQLMRAGCGELGLADTSGYADPAAVRRMVRLLHRTVGDEAVKGIHLHNTRGLGLANALAAFDEGITTFDSSLAGLGGCPFAPGASGNVVTEDLCFMFESMGVETGIDLEALFQIRSILSDVLPEEPLYGFAAHAGLPLGFLLHQPMVQT
jgi:hydroxymethylglutaryl-CoA lyase